MMSTKQKTKKVKAVQQKKKLFRANEPVLSVFMWGVNYSVSDQYSYVCYDNIRYYTGMYGNIQGYAVI